MTLRYNQRMDAAPFTPHDLRCLNVVVGQLALYHVCPHAPRSMTGWATLAGRRSGCPRPRWSGTTPKSSWCEG